MQDIAHKFPRDAIRPSGETGRELNAVTFFREGGFNILEEKDVKQTIAPIAILIAAFPLQSQTRPSFDVATIKRAVRSAASGEDGRNGVLRMWNVSLKRCIRYAYNIPEDQILGGPKWIDELPYDILAKVDHAVDEPELLTMLQPLLADRFKLRLHQETRLMPGYILTVAKGGIKAAVADPDRHSGGNGGRGFIDSRAGGLAGLTIRLTALLGRPVLDMTGDKRKFDFHLQWNPEETLGGSSSASDYPSLITALQEQLGLKLESKKLNAEILVVDRAELPSEN